MAGDDTFVRVERWMATELGLSGSALIAYALAWGMCSARCYGVRWAPLSASFVAEWCGVSERNARRIMAQLVADGLLVRGGSARHGEALYMPSRLSGDAGAKASEPRPVAPCDEALTAREGMTKRPTGHDRLSYGQVGQNVLPSMTNCPIGHDRLSPNTDSTDKTDRRTLVLVPAPAKRERAPRASARPEVSEAARAAVERLNELTGSRFRASSGATLRLVSARLSDGMTAADLVAVVEAKCAEWAGDARMARYLRPETLFGTKCEGYREAARSVAARHGTADGYAAELAAASAASVPSWWAEFQEQQ